MIITAEEMGAPVVELATLVGIRTDPPEMEGLMALMEEDPRLELEESDSGQPLENLGVRQGHYTLVAAVEAATETMMIR